MKVQILSGNNGPAQDVFKNGKLAADLIPHVWENGEVEPILQYSPGEIVMFQTAMGRGIIVNAETKEPITIKGLPQEYRDAKRVPGFTPHAAA